MPDTLAPNSLAPADLLAAQRRRRREQPAAFAPAARRERLKRLLRAVEARRDGIAAAIRADLGRHESETLLTETFAVTAEIRHALRRLRSWTRDRWVAPTPAMLLTTSRVRSEPKGAVLIISPWNFPVSLALGPLASAVAAGNSVVLKPSEHAPATAALLARLLAETFPPEEVACIPGDAALSRHLASLPFDHVFFTGGTEAGRAVLRASADTLATVTLELGGKSPVLVLDDADIGDAARKIAWGRFINAGQTCLAPDYVLVPRRLAPDFLRATEAAVAAMFGTGSGGLPTDYARIVNDAHFRRLSGLLADAEAHGDRLVVEGRRDAATRLIGPTVAVVERPGSPLLEQEIFGPILAMLPYDRLDDALADIGSRPPPLCAYAFGRDAGRALAVLARLPAGASVVNDVVTQYMHGGLPFGGVGASGMGRSHGRYGFDAFSNLRAVMVRRRVFNPVRLMYPPYTRVTRFLIRMAATCL